MSLESSKNRWVIASVSLVLFGLAFAALYFARGTNKSVSALAADLRGADAHLRHDAARKLAKLGAEAKSAVPELSAALSDPDKRVRFHSAKALADIGMEAKPAAPAMIAAIHGADSDCRYYLVKALSKLDLDATHVSAVPGLIETLRDENPKSRYYAVKCLKEIGPAANSAIAPLRGLATDPDQEVRDAAASALKKVAKKI